MKSNTITINLNYNEDELELNMEELITSIKLLLKNKYKENNIAYEVIDTSIVNISIPNRPYQINPCPITPAYPLDDPNPPWYDPSPFRYNKVIDPPPWWKNQPTCTITPNTTQINSLVNNNKKGTK